MIQMVRKIRTLKSCAFHDVQEALHDHCGPQGGSRSRTPGPFGVRLSQAALGPSAPTLLATPALRPAPRGTLSAAVSPRPPRRPCLGVERGQPHPRSTGLAGYFRVTNHPDLPKTQEFPRIWNFRCYNQDSPTQSSMAGHPICCPETATILEDDRSQGESDPVNIKPHQHITYPAQSSHQIIANA
ncbi:uncharacterized protein LOC117093575 [Trachypithecus francoisi]|uniref:uncharacterized protein LOC117093575 n=1 Tax=Trachypithecus francoisi TaxID=54180 RepID=UPI00141B85F4|nr:uncharacterized protein LOC117093575 [Trachypithecus francoisi]